MGFASFGLTHQEENSAIKELIDTFPAMRSTTAEQVLQLTYQSEYGIFNHNQTNVPPLAPVKLHPKEDVVEGGSLYTHIRKFFHYRIHKHFGLGLMEFFELPPHVVELIYDIIQYDTLGGERTHRELERQLHLDLDE